MLIPHQFEQTGIAQALQGWGDRRVTVGRVSRDVWTRTARLVRDVYQTNNALTVDVQLLAHALRAFRDVAELVNRRTFKGRDWPFKVRYFWGNWGEEDAPALTVGVDHRINSFASKAPSACAAEFYTHNLEVLLFHDVARLSDDVLTRAPSPYAQSLLILAVEGFWRRPQMAARAA